jgi:predicted PurR-regulated permease PerM
MKHGFSPRANYMNAMETRISPESKRLLLVGLIIVIAVFLYVVRDILTIFVLAILITYVLLPAVERLVRWTRLSRGLIVALLYLLLLTLIVGPMAMVAPRMIHQIQETNVDLQAITQQVYEMAVKRGPISVGGVNINPSDVYSQVQGFWQLAVSYITARTADLVVSIVSTLSFIFLTLVIAFYLLKETPRFSHLVLSFTTSPYHPDVRRMLAEVHVVFGTFLRGQLLLMLSVFLMTSVALTLVGLRNALPLALAAGLLEIVPIIGPVLAAIPAVLIAFFQDPIPYGLNSVTYTLLIVGVYIVIQQIEGNLLVPNIIGRSVNLHPAAVIFGVLAGATIGGLLGVFLAAPVAASLRIVGRFVLQLLLDQHPTLTEAVAQAPSVPASPTATPTAAPAGKPMDGTEDGAPGSVETERVPS